MPENPLLFGQGGIIAPLVEEAGGNWGSDCTGNRGGLKRHVLMIAYHYPPCRGSSGVQRTLSFSRHLPGLGWNPVVLSASPRAYLQVAPDQLQDIPSIVKVKRAFALDSARHLSWRGRYLDWTALPDRWVTWLLSAVPAGLRLIREYRPQLLWSTYPIATAHFVAVILHILTKIPWVADFRDPMLEIDPVSLQRWPADPNLWKAREFIERLTVKHSSKAVFVTSGAREIYTQRYPQLADNRCVIIPNGYDEQSFAEAEKIVNSKQKDDRRLVLLHSGTVYPTADRDPSALFAALAKLRKDGIVSADTLQIVLRASEHDEYHRRLVQHYEVDDMVCLAPPIEYRNALAEMLHVHGLLLFQGHDSNPAIPAKLYEYLRARRPIFAMVDAEGETAKALCAARVGRIVPLNSAEEIAYNLEVFLREIREGSASVLDEADVRNYSRESQSEELARLFESLVSEGA